MYISGKSCLRINPLSFKIPVQNVAEKHKYLRGPKVLRNPVLSRAILFFISLPPANPHKAILKSTLLGGYSSPSRHSSFGIGQLDEGLRTE